MSLAEIRRLQQKQADLRDIINERDYELEMKDQLLSELYHQLEEHKRENLELRRMYSDSVTSAEKRMTELKQIYESEQQAIELKHLKQPDNQQFNELLTNIESELKPNSADNIDDRINQLMFKLREICAGDEYTIVENIKNKIRSIELNLKAQLEESEAQRLSLIDQVQISEATELNLMNQISILKVKLEEYNELDNNLQILVHQNKELQKERVYLLRIKHELGNELKQKEISNKTSEQLYLMSLDESKHSKEENQMLIDGLRAEISELSEIVSDYSKQLKLQRESAKENIRTIRSRELEVGELRQQAGELRQQVGELRQQVGELQLKLKTIRQDMSRKDRLVKQLKDKIESSDTEIHKLSHVKSDAEIKVKSLVSNIQTKDVLIKQLRRRVLEVEGELEKQLEESRRRVLEEEEKRKKRKERRDMELCIVPNVYDVIFSDDIVVVDERMRDRVKQIARDVLNIV